MQFTIHNRPIEELQTQALVVFAFEDRTTAEEKRADALLGGQIKKLRSSKDFLPRFGRTRLIFHSVFPRVLLTGLGKQKDFSLEVFRGAVGRAINEIGNLPVKNCAFLMPKTARIPMDEMSQALTEAALLTDYKFSYYKDADPDGIRLEQVTLVAEKQDAKKVAAGCLTGEIVGSNVNAVRDLGNHPANVATPSHLAEHALAIAKADRNIKVKVLHRTDIKKEKMEALLAVSQGSDEEPKFIILEYRGRKTGPMVALVGKGITFDSGGISIKPSEKMEEMKYDMAGAATVMGIIKLASQMKLPIDLVGLIPATENLPSGKAIKPGDIVRSRSGKTIEIVNTDAEGRLVLADALDYAKKYKPALIMDFATLTGAIVVALGDDLIGAFANRENLFPKLEQAAKITGEKIWPMPLEQDYEQFIKSDFADLRNIGTTRYGDSINAANFLKEFVGDTPWVHFDIAGVAWATREKPYRPKGATGTGVRLAIEFLKKFRK
ncbi:MAG: leucyl aminopeptidase [Candidatus Doudnabacteria bacterium]|nr:leucyl aminopeptidase [bacterium]MDZ4243942.1 leucyl aminopeptidase [Candidatus Doudnabacteria bacterium]